MIPTLIGITLVCFAIINLAPGSPIEQKIQQLKFGGLGDAGSAGGGVSDNSNENAVSQEVIDALKKQYGFDKPVHIRYWIWIKNLSRLDFGESFTYEEPVIDVVKRRFPVSVQFGLVSFFLSYLICIPLGIWKATKNGSALDVASSVTLFGMYSIPNFMLAILLIVALSGGNPFEWFPFGELYSDDYDEFTDWEKFKDRLHHAVLPLVCFMVGQFTVLTMLMKNSLLEEIKKDYIRTARAKGLGEKAVYFKHALRNALIPIVTGFGGFLTLFFAGSLLLEVIFNLEGIGQLSYQSILERDYNVTMGLIFVQSFLTLIGTLMSDICYVIVDPRIDFS
jgi:microcin C transport system permease protein